MTTRTCQTVRQDIEPSTRSGRRRSHMDCHRPEKLRLQAPIHGRIQTTTHTGRSSMRAWRAWSMSSRPRASTWWSAI